MGLSIQNRYISQTFWIPWSWKLSFGHVELAQCCQERQWFLVVAVVDVILSYKYSFCYSAIKWDFKHMKDSNTLRFNISDVFSLPLLSALYTVNWLLHNFSEFWFE